MTDRINSVKKQEADSSMKEADKLWKPDWDGASFLYEKAANSYRSIKAFENAKYCFQRLSLCKLNVDEYYMAAKNLESASTMAKDLGDIQECTKLLIEASKLYRTNGNSFQAADTMTKAAKLLEDTDLEKTISLLMDSCELFELDDKDHYSGDTFKLTISMLLRHKKYFEAIDLMVLQNRDDVVGAKKKYESFLVYPSFLHSQEGITSNELISAALNNDYENLKKICSRHLFNFLDNQVAKIAKTLGSNSNGNGNSSLTDSQNNGKESVL
eukprot:gene6733-8349_t